MSSPPVVLTIAGFDSSGGAGVLADLKTIHALGGYGCAVITAQTVQNTQGVRDIWLEPTDGVCAQIAALLEDLPIAAVKIGMLGSDEMAAAVTRSLRHFDGPIVVDPVLKSTSGATLMEQGEAFDTLLRRATLITPNLDEAQQLWGSSDIRQISRMKDTAILLKGGHGPGETLVDQLLMPDRKILPFEHPRIDTPNTHGTGCVLSSAIATLMARGRTLPQAVAQAIEWLQVQLRASHWRLGRGNGPINITAESSPP